MQFFGEPIRVRPEELYLDRRGLSEEERIAEMRRLETGFRDIRYDLERGPLVTLKVADFGEGRYQILFSTYRWNFETLGELRKLRVIAIGEHVNAEMLVANQAVDRHHAVDAAGVKIDSAPVIVLLKPAEAIGHPVRPGQPGRRIHFVRRNRLRREQFGECLL